MVKNNNGMPHNVSIAIEGNGCSDFSIAKSAFPGGIVSSQVEPGAVDLVTVDRELEKVELKKKLSDLVELAKSIEITCQEDLDDASELTEKIKGFAQVLSDYFDPNIKKLHTAWKTATTERKPFADAIEEAEKLVKQKSTDYLKALEEERQRKQRELIEAAEKLKKEEEEKLARQIEKAEAAGLQEVAETLKSQSEAVEIEVPEVLSSVKIPKGQGLRKVWKARVVDEDKVPRKYMIVDQVLLNRLATTHKGEIQVPGVEFYQDLIVSNSAKLKRS